MISTKTIFARFSKTNPVVINVLIGTIAGYFLLHPITMVVYWFEFNETPITFAKFIEVFLNRMASTFHFQMLPMAILFATLGGLLGLGPGLFIKRLKLKKHDLYGREKLLQKSIPSLIKDGVGQFVEFRSSLKFDYRQVSSTREIEDLFIRSIAGFLNSNGGMILIGVNSEGQILGLSNDYWLLKKKNKASFQQRIMSLVAAKLGKDLCTNLHISFHTIKEEEICSVFIEPSNRPVYIADGNSTIFYVRTANITNPLTTREAVEYLGSRNLN